MIRTLIIDDEKNARINTLNMINTYCNNIEVVDCAYNVADGIDKIKRHKPKLVLLDIDMPDGTGFDLLSQLLPVDFCVIFITAYAEYAITAIKFNALDFIVKPIDPEDLLLAVNKAVKQLQDQHYPDRMGNLLSEVGQTNTPRMAFSNSDAVFFVAPGEIIRIEADANYSHVYLSDGRKITISKPLKEYVDMLERFNFFRPHQSHLINLDFLKEYKKKDGGYLKMSNGETIPVSTRKKDKLLQVFKGQKI